MVGRAQASPPSLPAGAPEARIVGPAGAPPRPPAGSLGSDGSSRTDPRPAAPHAARVLRPARFAPAGSSAQQP